MDMKIIRAEVKPNGALYYCVCVDETLPADQQQFEEFTYGSDTAEADAEREMVLLLQDKYREKPAEKLAVEGAQIDLDAGIIIRSSES